MIVGDPFVGGAIVDEQTKLRYTVVLIKILDIEIVTACSASETKGCRTFLCRRNALDSLSAGSSFTWNNIERDVAIQQHGFGLNAIGIMAHAAELIRYAGDLKKPIANSVAPNDGVSGLELKTLQYFRIAIFIH